MAATSGEKRRGDKPSGEKRSGASLLSRLLLATVAPILIFGLLETAVRITGVGARPSASGKTPGFQLLSDGNDGAMMIAHPTRFYQPRANRLGISRTDDMGFRGGPHPKTHDNLFRVAVIGDSCAMGFGTLEGESFAGILGQRLRAVAPGLDIDIINAGVTGYSTYQNRLDLRERVLPLEPDVVVLAISGWNDANGAVGRSDSAWAAHRESLPYQMVEHSRLLGLVANWTRSDPDSEAPGSDVAEVRDGSRPAGSRVPLPEFRANLKAMTAAIREAGAAPYAMVLSITDTQRSIDDLPAQYQAAARDVFASDHTPTLHADAILGHLDERLFLDAVHPNEDGHRLLGDALFDAVSRDKSLATGGRAARALKASAACVTSISPTSIRAGGGDTLQIFGSGFGDHARIYLGGESAEVIQQTDDTATVRVPRLPPGRLDVCVQIRNGSHTLESALDAIGPSLSIEQDGDTLRALIHGRPTDDVRLVVGSQSGTSRRSFRRTSGIDPAAVLMEIPAGRIGPDGSLSFEVPLKKRRADGTPVPWRPQSDLFVEALILPSEDPPPRIEMVTDCVPVPMRPRGDAGG